MDARDDRAVVRGGHGLQRLLENANAGSCGFGAPCCPSPLFPNSVLDCADLCTDSAGVNPSSGHPICEKICASGDAACSSQSDSCLQECNAHVAGVTGLCALCLLEGANGGSCGFGAPCCPNPEFPTSITDCASVCGG